MRRRNVITAIGTLAVGTGIAMGTGAFTTTSAERSFTVSTADDDAALLSLDVGNGTEANEIVNNSSNSNDRVSFDFNSINRNAYTAFDNLLSVSNLDNENNLDIEELTFTPFDGDGNEVSSEDSPVKVYLAGTDPIDEDAFELEENTPWEIRSLEKLPMEQRPDTAYRKLAPHAAGTFLIDDLGKAERFPRSSAPLLSVDQF
jgi:hypothetical protein